MLVGLMCLVTSTVKAAPKQELEKQCLASAIYHEAGSEPLQGQYAVGQVIINRVNAGFASTVCGVTHQHVGSHWQFGYNVVDPRHMPTTRAAYFENVADNLLNGEIDPNLPEDVLYFNNKPFDKTHYELYTKIGNQLFYKRHKKALKFDSPLRGTHDSIVHQNIMEKNESLSPIANDEVLIDLENSGQLIRIQVSDHLIVSSALPPIRKYCRPWTNAFLVDVSNAFYEKFHQPLMVDSAVRTVEFQKKLIRKNKNAAAIDGDASSPHMTGIAVDINKTRFTSEQLEWMRNYLSGKEFDGTLDAEEEFHQKVFHISVYKEYIYGALADIIPTK